MVAVCASFPHENGGKAGMGCIRKHRPHPNLRPLPGEGVFELALPSTLDRSAPSPAKGRVGGEAGVSASMLAACRTVARCNGQRALQGGLAGGKSTLWAFCHLRIALYRKLPLDTVASTVAGGRSRPVSRKFSRIKYEALH